MLNSQQLDVLFCSDIPASQLPLPTDVCLYRYLPHRRLPLHIPAPQTSASTDTCPTDVCLYIYLPHRRLPLQIPAPQTSASTDTCPTDVCPHRRLLAETHHRKFKGSLGMGAVDERLDHSGLESLLRTSV